MEMIAAWFTGNQSLPRSLLKSMEMIAAWFAGNQSLSTSKTMAEVEYVYLPDDCWECIFKFLNDGGDDYRSLSVVSKQLFSITNRLRSSLSVYYPTLRYLIRLFHRFPNLTSLDFTHFHGDLNPLLHHISLFQLKLTSLNISQKHQISLASCNLLQKPPFPDDGLRFFSQYITTLTSLICSNVPFFTSYHLFVIAECFPLLEELDLGHYEPEAKIMECDSNKSNYRKGLEALSLSHSKLRKINLTGHYYMDDKSIFHLFKNCKLLEEVILPHHRRLTITKEGVASALSEKQTTLRYLSLPKYITTQVIDSLMNLKGLTYINLSLGHISDELLISLAMEGPPLKRFAISDCTGYSLRGLFSLFFNCPSIQHLKLSKVPFLNDHYVMKLSSYLVSLVSISINSCLKVTDSSLFALVRKCPSLSEIKMKKIGCESVENYDNLMDFGVYPQLNSLSLPSNQWLTDERIAIIVSGFPNLHLLDLKFCTNISQGVVQILKRCPKISHLNLTAGNLKSSKDDLIEAYRIRNLSSRVNLLGMSFEVPKLKMLNLSFSKIDDEALYSISKSCCGLLQLLLNDCSECTEKGVKHVVENCTQLREINLKNCWNVRTSIAPSELFSTPSLRKITPSPYVFFTISDRILFLQRGCVVL